MKPSSGVSSLSQITAWDTSHLETAAIDWSAAAQHWEDSFAAIHQGTLSPGGTVWEGDGADAAADRTFGDLVKVRGAASCLIDAARIARNGADDLAWAKGRVLEAVTDAQEAQFAVAENLSVSDPTTTVLMRGSEIRQAQAQTLAAEIGSRATVLIEMDREVAGKIAAALAPLHGIRFDEAPDSPAQLAGWHAPPTGIVWCRDHPGGGYMCRELLPNGTISIFASPTDISGHWPD